MRRVGGAAAAALLLAFGATAAETTAAEATAAEATPAASPAAPVVLPGIRYEVLASGPAGGVQPTRADAVTMRYVGRLTDGAVFSTSPGGGAEPYAFKVREVIPGMSAALQLMRPGDKWRITMPAYLAYGRLGRKWAPGEPLLKRDVPPEATLVFDVELVSVAKAAP
ncbi:FKBP-type peptidyl-prolyl cis-trans isomerase [Phenylobacterium soli]|nr:FKBP-type peptidyl-prolyl cis-trans isomerase [Phenylobacterium soli]